MTDDPHSAASCQRIVFHGRVQGVGFRYTVAGIARRYPVKGYVRNLSDGSVELVVAGSAGAISAFTAEIGHAFRENIERQTAEDINPEETFVAFEIRR